MEITYIMEVKQYNVKVCNEINTDFFKFMVRLIGII